ncbi:MAG TPA: ABC transporter permease [Kofleriaceae bacterium]|nr:ABC transporter permease [Kofleriaceae bacterium]
MWRDAWRRLRKNRMAVVCAAFTLAMVIFCVAGPWIAGLFGLDETTIDAQLGAVSPRGAHWLGTDTLGRDMLVRCMHGGRIALLVALTATLVALVIGVSWGAIAAYAGGRTDYVMMRIVDVLYGFPTLVFVIVVMATFNLDSLVWLFALIGAISWLTMARLVRAQVMSLRHRDFVEAARALGARPSRILFRHIVPNTMGVVIVYATLSMPSVMLYEAVLSYLGVGVHAPRASWGTLVTEGASQIIAYPWLLYGPGLMMATTIFALNFFGDGLRDALDPQTRKD